MIVEIIEVKSQVTFEESEMMTVVVKNLFLMNAVRCVVEFEKINFAKCIGC